MEELKRRYIPPDARARRRQQAARAARILGFDRRTLYRIFDRERASNERAEAEAEG